mgnify:CR=1 FL=1
MVPNWVTASGYTEELNVRTKVGDAQEATRIGFVAEQQQEVLAGGVAQGHAAAADAHADPQPRTRHQPLQRRCHPQGRIRIDADGRMKVLSVGDVGHLPPNLQTGATGDGERSLSLAPMAR